MSPSLSSDGSCFIQGLGGEMFKFSVAMLALALIVLAGGESVGAQVRPGLAASSVPYQGVEAYAYDDGSLKAFRFAPFEMWSGQASNIDVRAVAVTPQGGVVTLNSTPSGLFLEQFVAQGGVLVLADSAVFPGSCGLQGLSQLAFDSSSGGLVFYCSSSHEVWVSTSISGGIGLSGWTQVLQPGNLIPDLVNAVGPLRLSPFDALGVVPGQLAVALSSPAGEYHEGWIGFSSPPQGGGLTPQFVSPDLSMYSQQIMITSDSVAPGASSVHVSGAVGIAAELRVNSASYSILTSSDTGEATVTLSAPIAVGDRLVILDGAGNQLDRLYVLQQYKNPLQSSAGNLLISEFGTPVGCEVGNSRFALELGLRSLNPAATTSYVAGLGIAGFAGEIAVGEHPILLDPQGIWTLDLAQTALVPISGYIDTDGLGKVRFSYPIPNDPSLVGALAFAQVALTFSGETVYSDVVGMRIAAAQ